MTDTPQEQEQEQTPKLKPYQRYRLNPENRRKAYETAEKKRQALNQERIETRDLIASITAQLQALAHKYNITE